MSHLEYLRVSRQVREIHDQIEMLRIENHIFENVTHIEYFRKFVANVITTMNIAYNLFSSKFNRVALFVKINEFPGNRQLFSPLKKTDLNEIII